MCKHNIVSKGNSGHRPCLYTCSFCHRVVIENYIGYCFASIILGIIRHSQA